MIDMIISVRRHAESKKDPNDTTKKLDELTEAGIQKAKEIGSQLHIPKSGIIGYHSPKNRAYQTLNAIMQGAGIKNPQISEDKSLDSIKITPEYRKFVLSQGSSDECMQYIMDNPDPKGQSFSDSGMDIHKFIKKVYEDFVNTTESIGKETLIEGVSHAPKVEAGLVYLLGCAGKKITKLDEIGGGFKPAEGFKLTIEYNNKSGLYKATLDHRGEKTQLHKIFRL